MLMVFIWFDFCTIPFDVCKSQIRPWQFFSLFSFCLWLCQDIFFVIKLRLFHQIAQILTYRENCMMWTSFLVRASSFDSIQFNSFWFCCLHTQTIAISNWEKWSTFGIYSCCERSVACKNHDCSFGSIIYGVLINNNEYTHIAHRTPHTVTWQKAMCNQSNCAHTHYLFKWFIRLF